MELIDVGCYKQVLGSLIENPRLLLEYEIVPDYFGLKVAKIVFSVIDRLFKEEDFKILNIVQIDERISQQPISATYYTNNHGLEFLQECEKYHNLENFEYYYNTLKKLYLTKTLIDSGFDVSHFFKSDFKNMKEEEEYITKFEEMTIEDIINSIEIKISVVKEKFLNGSDTEADAGSDVKNLLEYLKRVPEEGCDLEGPIYSTIHRGARRGKFYLRSASSGTGKSRLSIYDACRIVYPERWSHKEQTFIKEKYGNSEVYREARKLLFIVTELTKDEVQTIILSYLSGIDEEHIITSNYFCFEEQDRVMYAASIMEKYQDFFFIEQIPDPNLSNIESVVKKYATLNGIQYVGFDYIHTSPSLLAQFQAAKIREDVALLLISNKLKELAVQFNLFMFSSTQVNANAMDNDDFKDESCIRGSRAVADKVDSGVVMSRVSDGQKKKYISLLQANPNLARELGGHLPTHVFDIYKMRRGRYKNVRLWSYIDLSNGYREDLLLTTIDNQIINIKTYKTIDIERIENWKNEIS